MIAQLWFNLPPDKVAVKVMESEATARRKKSLESEVRATKCSLAFRISSPHLHISSWRNPMFKR